MGRYGVNATAQNRETWAKALLDGNLQQISGQLKIEGGYCCLGVACEISNLGRWMETDPDWYETNDGRSTMLFLPRKVQEWLGVSCEEVMVTLTYNQLRDKYDIDCDEIDGAYYSEPTLSVLNDNGVPFSTIAQIILDDHIELEDV